MPGDDWQGFANLRALLGYQWFFPGKKLLFMGCELGQSSEWNVNAQVDWALLGQGPYHAGVQRWVCDLNAVYRAEPALWRGDYEEGAFRWIDTGDHANSVLSFVRFDRESGGCLLVVLNLTPTLHRAYRIGLPQPGRWIEVLNSDAAVYGGGNQGNGGAVASEPVSCHGLPQSAAFVLPPLSLSAFRPASSGGPEARDGRH